MRIKEITSQTRRDFWAIYECKHCGHSYAGGGYDDDNFHRNVVPDIVCSKCGKKAAEEIALNHMNDGSEVIESSCAEIIDISLEEPT